MTSLRRGDRGPRVVELQSALNAIGGARLVTDGDFGPATEAAVFAFQFGANLTRDGIAGPATLGALGLDTRDSAPPTQPTGASIPPPPPSDPLPPELAALEVPRVRTQVLIADLSHVLRHAWQVTRESPIEPLRHRMILAHWAFEHGTELAPLRLRACYCNNFGNVMLGKGRAPWFAMTAKEVIGGVEIAKRSKWRAYGTITDGVVGYLASMRRSFPAMLEAMATGDAVKVARAGKAEGYYTANESDYSARLAGVYKAAENWA